MESESLEGLAVRLSAFVLIAIVGAWFDCRRQPADRDRRELYATILGAGCMAGLFGAAWDQVSSTISPEYFSVVKEIPRESELRFRLHLALYGFAAGLVPGLIAGVCASIANYSIQPQWRAIQLAKYAAYPIGIASVAIPIVWWSIVSIESLHVDEQFAMDMPKEWIGPMSLVWAIHLSLYIGGVIGTIAGTIQIVRHKKQQQLNLR